jgi:hypothetical protein
LDLNPCDYLLWGFQKDNIYRHKIHMDEELKVEITATLVSINEEKLAVVMEDVNVSKWCRMHRDHFLNMFLLK